MLLSRSCRASSCHFLPLLRVHPADLSCPLLMTLSCRSVLPASPHFPAVVSRCPCPPFPSSQLSPHTQLNPQGEHKAESCTVMDLPKYPSQHVPASEGMQINVATCCLLPTWSSLSGCTCPPASALLLGVEAGILSPALLQFFPYVSTGFQILLHTASIAASILLGLKSQPGHSYGSPISGSPSGPGVQSSHGKHGVSALPFLPSRPHES